MKTLSNPLIKELKKIRDKVLKEGTKKEDLQNIKEIINSKEFNINEAFYDFNYTYSYITATMYLCEILAYTPNLNTDFIKEYIKNNANPTIFVKEYLEYDLLTVLIYNLKSQYIKVQTIDFLIEHFKNVNFAKDNLISDETKIMILKYYEQNSKDKEFRQKCKKVKKDILLKKIEELEARKKAIQTEINELKQQLKD